MLVPIRSGKEITRTMFQVNLAYAAKPIRIDGILTPSEAKSAILLANLLTLLTVSLACIFDPLLRL